MPWSRRFLPFARLQRKEALFAILLLLLFLIMSAFPSAAFADEAPTRSARVIYHFVDAQQLESNTSFAERESTLSSVSAGEVWDENEQTMIRANAYPQLMAVSAEPYAFRVIKDYASTSATGKGAQDITSEAHYDASTGIVSLPGQYANEDLTVVWYVAANTQKTELPLQVDISKTMGGVSSETTLEHTFVAGEQVINVKLFDDEETAARVQHLSAFQGGRELTQFVFQNGSISLVASPLGGPICIEVDDATEEVSSGNDSESAFNTEPPLFALFSAANPVVGERFTLDADSALIRTCEPGGNMAQVMGWPEKSGTYGFAVHFNHCVNPEVMNADQNHVAPGGTVRTPGGGTYDYNWVKGMHFAWGECYGDVDDNGTGEPKVQSGWVEVTNVDYATQTVSYRFFLNVCSDIDGHNMQSIMGTFQVHEDLVGYIELKKQSALGDISADNTCYSLEGACYGIYSDADCTDLKQTLTTDAHGCARSKALPVGTYYLKEISTPAGFAIDVEAHEVNVSAGTTRTATLNEVPQSDPTPLLLAKYDSDRAYDSEHNAIQGGATSFDGAEFTVTFYPTLESDYAQVAPLRTWVMKTDEHGFIDLRQGEGCKVAGDDLYYDTTGAITLPLGTYVIKETKAPEGYRLNESSVIRTVTGMPNSEESVSSYDPPLIADDVIRGGIELEKRDAESGLQSALGAATLDGTTFTITNDNSHEVYVNGVVYQPGEICVHLSVKDGAASCGATTLPYGDYTLREISAGDGYNTSAQNVRSFTIEHDGQIVRFSDSAENPDASAFKNQVKRGDLNFIKVRETDGKRLEGIPFKITSHTTGESHIVVSDANGIIDTSADWVKHTHETNANDEGEPVAGRGVWFGQTKMNARTEPRDDLGALPFDSYTLEELPCEANEGLELVTTEFSIYRDQQKLDFGVIENHDPLVPWLYTMASDSSDHDKLIDADNEAVINDHIQYGNLTEGETYTLRGALADPETGELLPSAAGETTFTATGSTGSAEVSIPVNLLDQAGKRTVVYETLLHDDEVILEHKENDNSEQTVSIIEPRIGTTAVDAADGDHEILNDAEVRIVDTVHFTNLVPGKEYTVIGSLMAKERDDEGVVGTHALTHESGEEITAQNTFTPQTESGSVEVTFTFNASAIEPGSELVVFERLMRGESEIATHADPEDEDQTVRVIEPEEPPAVPSSNEPQSTDTPLSDSPQSFFAKTGSSIIPWITGALVLVSGATVLIVLAFRKRRQAQAVTNAIARNMLGNANDQRFL